MRRVYVSIFFSIPGIASVIHFVIRLMEMYRPVAHVASSARTEIGTHSGQHAGAPVRRPSTTGASSWPDALHPASHAHTARRPFVGLSVDGEACRKLRAAYFIEDL